ncbi:hypothetical protein AWZ03_015462, partial [Drosophila navojoa]
MPRGYTAEDGDEDMDVEVASPIRPQPSAPVLAPSKLPARKSAVMAQPTTSRAAAQQVNATPRTSTDAIVADYLAMKSEAQSALQKTAKLLASDRPAKRTAEKGGSPKKKTAQLDADDLDGSDEDCLLISGSTRTTRTVDAQKEATRLANKICSASKEQIMPPKAAAAAATSSAAAAAATSSAAA